MLFQLVSISEAVVIRHLFRLDNHEERFNYFAHKELTVIFVHHNSPSLEKRTACPADSPRSATDRGGQVSSSDIRFRVVGVK